MGIDFVEVQNKGKVLSWVCIEIPLNSVSVIVFISFKYTHSCFCHFEFVS